MPAALQNSGPHPQPGERLPQFQTDHTRSHDQYTFRELMPFEYIVVDDGPVTQWLVLGRNERPAAGGDNHTARLHPGMAPYFQNRVGDKPCLAIELIPFRHGFNIAQNKAYEAVPFLTDTAHHILVVNPDIVDLHTK